MSEGRDEHFEPVILRDGRELTLRLATHQDAVAVAACHELPTKVEVPEAMCRAHFELKAAIYVSVPACGLITGWVDEDLAGFQFFSSGSRHLRRFLMTPRGWLLVARRLFRRGRLFNPAFTAQSIRWGIQHLRKPSHYTEVPAELAERLPEYYYGTVQAMPEYRRLGVGSALTVAASQLLRKQGAKAVCVWISTENAASISLFESLGGQKVAECQRLGEKCWLLRQSLVEQEQRAE